MYKHEDLKPIYRSSLRTAAGKAYYTWSRYLQWFTRRNTFSEVDKGRLPYVIMAHKTPLYRQLKDVDMWLQANKVCNLRIAARRLDGVLLKSDQTFSYWKSIGKPTYRKGYKDGMVLHYGTFKSGVGGGLCQLSNLIYWMILHTPLTVTERHRHSFDVFPDAKRTQPFGSGATCVYNYRDLQIKNETNEQYQIRVWLDDTHLHGQILSNVPSYLQYTVYESRHEMSHQYWGGYVRENEIRREVQDSDGYVICDERVCENRALMMYEPLLE